MNGSERPRRGASLLVAIVLLAVTTALLAAAAKTAAVHRRSLAAVEAAAQADLLADAAGRATRRRAGGSGGGDGTAWEPELPGGTASVQIGEGNIEAVVTVGGAAARARRAVGGVDASRLPGRAPLLAPKPETADDR